MLQITYTSQLHDRQKGGHFQCDNRTVPLSHNIKSRGNRLFGFCMKLSVQASVYHVTGAVSCDLIKVIPIDF